MQIDLKEDNENNTTDSETNFKRIHLAFDVKCLLGSNELHT